MIVSSLAIRRLDDYDFSAVFMAYADDIPWNSYSRLAFTYGVGTDVFADRDSLRSVNAKVSFFDKPLAKVLIGV